MADTQFPLIPSNYYHVYNRAIGFEKLFVEDDDYLFFLGKTKKYLLPVCNILAYCLMPNHFHFIVKIKSISEVDELFISQLGNEFYHKKNSHDENYRINRISQQFGNLFNCYAKRYNHMNLRIGSIFKQNFRRKVITETDYLRTAICYTHQNPVEAGLVNNMEDWSHSSFCCFKENKSELISLDEVIELFGGEKNFLDLHGWWRMMEVV